MQDFDIFPGNSEISRNLVLSLNKWTIIFSAYFDEFHKSLYHSSMVTLYDIPSWKIFK